MLKHCIQCGTPTPAGFELCSECKAKRYRAGRSSPVAGSYWKNRIAWRDAIELGPDMRKNGLTLSLDFAYRSVSRGAYDDDLTRVWDGFERTVPVDFWQYAAEHRYGGVELRRRSWLEVSLSSIEFCYIMWRLLKHSRLTEPMLEIGGGYGGLARTVAVYVNSEEVTLDYTILDFEPMLRIQRHYLEKTARFSIESFTFRNTMPKKKRFGLIVNTRSMCEMDIAEINAYLEQIDSVLCQGGIFFSINHDRCINDYADWSVPAQWHLVEEIYSAKEENYPLIQLRENDKWVERVWRKVK